MRMVVKKKKKKIRSQKLLTTADSISYVLFFFGLYNSPPR